MPDRADAKACGFVEADGIWCEARRSLSFAACPALFLDRDGVVIEEKHYLSDPRGVRLLPGAATTIARARRLGIATVLVTNQAGIGRGMFDWREFATVQARLHELLAAEDAALDMVLACPFHAEGVAPYRHPAHPCRKPRPGMLLRAGERLGIDLARSWIVGDRLIDLQAGQAAGLAGGLHVNSGHGQGDRAAVAAWRDRDQAAAYDVVLGESLADAAGLPLWSGA